MGRFPFQRSQRRRDPGGYAVVALNGNGTNGPSFGVLFGQNIYGIDNNTSPDTQGVSATAVSGATTFFAAELNFSTGEEYLFLNPSTAGTPSTSGAAATLAMSSTFKTSGFDGVSLAAGYNSGSFNIDSLRIGTSFADVVPEPSTWAIMLAGLSILALAVRRRATT